MIPHWISISSSISAVLIITIAFLLADLPSGVKFDGTETMAAAKGQLNVLKQPLKLLSKEPMTGFYRNGYCQTGPEDFGDHSVGATLTTPFLTFSASRGNDLRTIGLKEGCRWCLCVSRWKEAFEYAKTLPEGSREREGLVPRVWLESTNLKALERVRVEDLRRFAADGDDGVGK